VSHTCKNCGVLINAEDWENYYGLCFKCFMYEDLNQYMSNNVDEILEMKRSNGKIEQ